MNSDAVSLQGSDALLLVDVQNDLLPGGSFPVPNADQILPSLNRCIHVFMDKHLPIVLSREWHARNHYTAAARDSWPPPHCIATSTGADFAAGLKVPRQAVIITKADAPDVEIYSAFQDTDLVERLHALNVHRLFVGGLLTEYNVRATVVDALGAGFAVTVLHDAVCTLDRDPGDGASAMIAMIAAGAVVTDTAHAFGNHHLHQRVIERIASLTHLHH